MDDGKVQLIAASPSWRSLWRLFSQAERKQLLAALLDCFDTHDAMTGLLKDIASRANMRAQTLRSWPRDRLIDFVEKRSERAISDRLYAAMFRVHFENTETEVFRDAFESLNLDLDPERDSFIPTLDRGVRAAAAEAAILHLITKHPEQRVARAVEYLRLRSDSWEQLASAMTLTLKSRQKDDVPPVTKSVTTVLEDFTTIDRVVIEQIVATSSQAEAALDDEELDDLVQTLIALNPRRKRSYFILGYVDVIISGRSLDFDRPEFDDERRSWYLAGALTGMIRQRHEESFVALLHERANVFRLAASASGPGLSMANTLLPDLVQLGRIGEASLLISTHWKAGGLRLAQVALDQVVRLLRLNAAADAMALARPLWEAYCATAPQGAASERLQRELARRMAQCLQAHGDFAMAEELLNELSDVGSESDQAKVLADRGLVGASVRSVFDLVLPSESDERKLRAEALQVGEPYFLESLRRSPGQVVSALYCLGQLRFLEWRLKKERDASKRDEAIRWLQGAVTQMRLSDAAEAYDRSGLLGQALFMLTLLTLHRLCPADINASMEHWRQITTEAGKFPPEDLRLLLEVAGMTTDAHATFFGESIWRHRRGEALDLVMTSALLERSRTLRSELRSYCCEPSTASRTQRKALLLLIPVLLRLNERSEAEDALDALEGIAEGDDGLEEVMQFLSEPCNYEPVWTELESLWCLVRLARRAGNDSLATDYLKTLFYRVRDQDVDVAVQIIDLMTNWRLDSGAICRLQSALPIPGLHAETLDVERRLRDGEAAKIVFIGGNEMQEQYDARIQESLAAEYPGISVCFRHTGWTSNWGHFLPTLAKECNESDAVVMMTMMRTMLGRRLRAELRRPWISCVARGEMGLKRSIIKAAHVAVASRPTPTGSP